MHNHSATLFEEAKSYFPGGVNSPVRAFKSVGGTPLFMKEGKGAKITDVDDKEYIDFCCSWGPLILGHAHERIVKNVGEALLKGTSFGTPTIAENKLGKLILENNPYIDKIRFVNSGTEAVMSALRLARGYTGRNKIIKFDGCYHGHVDSLLVKAGSGLADTPTATSKGIPGSVVNDTIILPLDNLVAVEEAFEQFKDEIACVIIEPIPANNGLLKQRREYLIGLKNLCEKHGALLFFDEVISGFRVHFSGAAGYYDIQPDLISYGKIIGGGFPVGAYGGKKEIMANVAPEGEIYQAGTLSGNPIAMTAGYYQLLECSKIGFYQELGSRTTDFVNNINAFCEKRGYNFHLTTIASIFWCVFGKKDISRADQIDASKMPTFSKLYHNLLERGIYMGPSGYEVGFVSNAHSESVLNDAAVKFKDALKATFE